jgi:hypothetical protein
VWPGTASEQGALVAVHACGGQVRNKGIGGLCRIGSGVLGWALDQLGLLSLSSSHFFHLCF